MRVTKTALKNLRKMSKEDASRLLDALELFEKTGKGDIKKLQGREGYRIRVGYTRAIFEKADEVIVLDAGYRGHIY